MPPHPPVMATVQCRWCHSERQVRAYLLAAGRAKFCSVRCSALYREANRPDECPDDTSARFWARVNRSDGCWVWTGGTGSHGYGSFVARRRAYTAHRFAWEVTHGPVPSGLFVCHRCDNPPCVNPDHLFLGTNADNLRDAAVKGRTAWSKVTRAEVLAMVALRASGMTLNALGKRFGLSESAVFSRIQREARWSCR